MKNGTSSLIVQLSQQEPVSHLHLNFGRRPPISISLSAGDDPSNLNVIVPDTTVNISAPVGSFDEAEVVVRIGNTTDIDIPETQAKFFKLTMEGCHEADGAGAAVAELALLSSAR